MFTDADRGTQNLGFELDEVSGDDINMSIAVKLKEKESNMKTDDNEVSQSRELNIITPTVMDQDSPNGRNSRYYNK